MWLDIINITKNLIIDLKNREDENKSRISALLLEISEVIQDAADKIEKGEYPHFSCSIMNKLSDGLKDSLFGLIDNRLLDEYYTKLKFASNLEQEFLMRDNPGTINQLRSVAGEFKASSMLLNI